MTRKHRPSFHATWNGQPPRLDQKTVSTLCYKRVDVRLIRGVVPTCAGCLAIQTERTKEFNRLYEAGKREVSI